MSFTLGFLCGIASASIGALVLLACVVFFAKGKATTTVERNRAIIQDLRGRPSTTQHRNLSSSTDSIDLEWTSGDCKIELCSLDNSTVLDSKKDGITLKSSLPMLFILTNAKRRDKIAAEAEKTEQRLATLLLESFKCELIKTHERRSNGEIKKVRHKWHKSNYLLLTPKSAETILKVKDKSYSSLKIWFVLNRELERWYSILQQGCQYQGLPAKTGQSWRHALAAVQQVPTLVNATAAEEAVNDIVGRLFFQWQQRQAFQDFITKKINHQLAKVDPPAVFKGTIKAVNVCPGTALPVFSNAKRVFLGEPRASGSNAVGDVAAEASVNYQNGEFSITLELNFDLSFAHFDVSVPLPRVLATVTVKSLEGRLRFEISSVSDYLWLGFVEEPNIDISIRTNAPELPSSVGILLGGEIPELTQLVVTFVKAEILELMVLPNMEDLYIPLINENEVEDTSCTRVETVDKLTGRSQSNSPVLVSRPIAESFSDDKVEGISRTPTANTPTEHELPPSGPQPGVTHRVSQKVKVNAKELFGGFRKSKATPVATPSSTPIATPAMTPTATSEANISNLDMGTGT
ncbi:hypothetical protein DIPPA_54178 [Diplonema papillatum]|nr:hypothetical protein DIPPA_54178 [Diplonema papillatum]